VPPEASKITRQEDTSQEHTRSSNPIQSGELEPLFANTMNSDAGNKRLRTEYSDHQPGFSPEQNSKLSPAQRFFIENKEKLLQRAKDYYLEKAKHLSDEDTEWSYYKDPVIRPPRDHLWDVVDRKTVLPKEQIEFESGKMPSMEKLVQLLEQETISDIRVIDLEECGRRDLGMYSVVGTGQTSQHCIRVGQLVADTLRSLKIPYVSEAAYCWACRSDEWIVSHCGPVSIHLLTKEWRKSYRLEDLWASPHTHFNGSDFASYFDYTPGIPPPYLLRSLSPISSVYNDDAFIEFCKIEDK